jgi:hypothetical protein
MEHLPVPAGGLLVREKRAGQTGEDVVDEEGFRPVQQQKRGDASGRGVAKESGDLQLRTLRRRS